VKKRIGPAVSIIKSAADTDALLESEGPIAIAYLQSAEGADADEFTAVARLEDGVDFHVTTDVQIAKKLGLNKNAPALVLLKKQNEKVATFGMCPITLWFDHESFVLIVMTLFLC